MEVSLRRFCNILLSIYCLQQLCRRLYVNLPKILSEKSNSIHHDETSMSTDCFRLIFGTQQWHKDINTNKIEWPQNTFVICKVNIIKEKNSKRCACTLVNREFELYELSTRKREIHYIFVKSIER